MTARKGWISDPPPKPPRDYIPGEEHKWRTMHGLAADGTRPSTANDDRR